LYEELFCEPSVGGGRLSVGGVKKQLHATIVLHDWHHVLMNRESDAPAMRHVAFLD
jgi:hypothetical protein